MLPKLSILDFSEDLGSSMNYNNADGQLVNSGIGQGLVVLFFNGINCLSYYCFPVFNWNDCFYSSTEIRGVIQSIVVQWSISVPKIPFYMKVAENQGYMEWSIQKQPFRGVLKLLGNFIKITLRHGCSPANLLHIFRTLFIRTPRDVGFWTLA